MKKMSELKILQDKRRPLYAKNETEANRQMCVVCGVFGIALFLSLLMYVFKVFLLVDYMSVYITFPILSVALVSMLFLRKTKFVERFWLKYLLFGLLLIVVGVINMLVPKHALLGYALIIVLSIHYYNPRLGKVTFISMLVVMLIAIYLSLFYGEYDPNLLTEGKIIYDPSTGEYVLYQPETPQERYEFLQELAHSGTNRFAAVLGFYYVGRALWLSLIFFSINAINFRTNKLLESEAEATKEKSRIETELSVAEEIQRSVLPNAMFQNKAMDLVAQLRPAREVGGDFYDYHWLDAEHVAILIGDVSGKGVPAAMFMMKTLTSFRAYYDLRYSPKEVVEKVNSLIYDGNETSMFVTLFFGIINTKTGEFRYVNAGHNPPMFRRKLGRFVPLPCDKGFILGTMPETHVVEQRIMLREGDSLLLYTDGITEAKNGRGELYGEPRLLRFLNGTGSKAISSVEFTHELEDSIDEFTQGAEQADDITYLLMIFRAEPVYFVNASFPADLGQGSAVRAFITDAANKANIKGTVLNNFLICIDEIFSNIVKYGQVPAGQNVMIRCLYRPRSNLVSMNIVDKGIPFDPRSVKATKVDEREDNAPVGGLGWLMVERLMDEVSYHRVNGKNVVSITKKL